MIYRPLRETEIQPNNLMSGQKIGKSLLFITDITQFRFIQNNYPDYFRKNLPITNDMAVAFEFERLNIDYIDEWDFLKLEDIEKNREIADTLAQTDWDTRYAFTENEIFAFPNVAKQDLVWPFEACLNARTIYANLFDEYAIESIRGYFLPPVALIRTGPFPANKAAQSVSQAVLFYMAEDRGIQVEKLRFELNLSHEDKIGQISHRHIEPPKRINKYDTPDKVVILCEWCMPDVERNALLKATEKLKGVRVISISQAWLVAATKSNSSRLEKNGFRSSENFSGYCGEYSEIFKNKHLTFQFERISEELKTAAFLGNIFEALLDVIRPDLVIFGHEAFTIERVMVRIAKKNKIPTASMVHGGLGVKYGHRGLVGDADTIWVWNLIDIEWLTTFGIDRSRLEPIGCCRYEDRYSDYLQTANIKFTSARSTAKTSIGVDKTKPLVTLVTASISIGLTAPIADPSKHRQTIWQLIQLIESRPDLQFIIKAHPGYDYHQLYGEILNAKLPNFIFNEKLKLIDILKATDICVMMNYCTTASIEAMLQSVPVILLNTSIYPLSKYEDSYLNLNISRVASVDALEKIIDDLLVNPSSREDLLDQAALHLKTLLGVEKFSVEDRLASSIGSLLRIEASNSQFELTTDQALRDFIYSNSEGAYQRRICAINKYGPDLIMYIIASLAGTYNLGSKYLPRIYVLCKIDKFNMKISPWTEARWNLLESYINGMNNRSENRNFLSGIRILIMCIVNPKKIFLSQYYFKRMLIKYLIIELFGHNALKIFLRLVR